MEIYGHTQYLLQKTSVSKPRRSQNHETTAGYNDNQDGVKQNIDRV